MHVFLERNFGKHIVVVMRSDADKVLYSRMVCVSVLRVPNFQKDSEALRFANLFLTAQMKQKNEKPFRRELVKGLFK